MPGIPRHSHYNVGLSLNEIRRSLLESVGDAERVLLESTVPALDVKVPKSGRGEVWTIGPDEANRLYAQLDGILAAANPSEIPQPVLPVNGGSGTSSIDVFVSHSSEDVMVVLRLITLVRSALSLRADRIRCTSVDGFRLPGGISTDERLRKEIYESTVFVGLITPHSVVSTYVLFELGARWGAGRLMIPLLARGATVADLRGPIGALNALSCDEPAQLHQFIDELGKALGAGVDKPAAYEKCIRETVEESLKR